VQDLAEKTANTSSSGALQSAPFSSLPFPTLIANPLPLSDLQATSKEYSLLPPAISNSSQVYQQLQVEIGLQCSTHKHIKKVHTESLTIAEQCHIDTTCNVASSSQDQEVNINTTDLQHALNHLDNLPEHEEPVIWAHQMEPLGVCA
jgi:hypothetical protein